MHDPPPPLSLAKTRLGAAPFGIYVHIPFCAHRCGYCPFVTTATHQPSDSDTFVEALEGELGWILDQGVELPVAQTVYLGGGTPTLLSNSQLEQLLSKLRSRVAIAQHAELTIEANPETLDRQRIRALADLGVTRLSVGVQHVDPGVLFRLERQHEPGRSLEVVAMAVESSIPTVSADLIFGTPGETTNQWLEALHAVLDTGINHLSAYALSLEPGTRLQIRERSGRMPPLSEPDLEHRYRLTNALLSARGFNWYEVSNWAADVAARSAHNLLYWRNHDWLGLGPGAHSHIAGLRWWNTADISRYLGHAGRSADLRQSGESLNAEQRALEKMMLGLRISEGIERDSIAPEGHEVLEMLIADGLLVRDPRGGRLRATLDGRLLIDTMARKLADFTR